jgi:hypothetical protein
LEWLRERFVDVGDVETVTLGDRRRTVAASSLDPHVDVPAMIRLPSTWGSS